MLRERMGWLQLSGRVPDEIRQCEYEGKMIESWKEQAQELFALEEGEEKEEKSRRLLLRMEESLQDPDFSYTEPESYSEIQMTLSGEAEVKYQAERDVIDEKIRGAWYGRCIGCLLGIPVEGWTREKIKNFLEDSEQYPVTGYFRSDVGAEVREKYQISDTARTRSYDRTKICWRNNISSFPVDDDTNYTILALRLLEDYGKDFTSEDVLETWLYSVPALHACTAERVAIQNALALKFPPESAKYMNPYREWIGAQIRGDLFGYVTPGDPHTAAAMAYRDGTVSHVKNGVYGEMYIAAMLSLSYVSGDSVWICKEALKQIPPESRLAEGVCSVIQMKENGSSFEEVIQKIHGKYRQDVFFDWCYVVPNAMIVTACVLWFAHDYSQGIIQSVLAGFDTDCNGATVGSVLGLINGFSAIDKKWLDGIEPVLHTSVHKYKELSLEEIVDRTKKLCL